MFVWIGNHKEWLTKSEILKSNSYLFSPILHVVQDSKIQLPVIQLRKVWAEAVHYVSGLKEDYSRLFQGQRAAMWVESVCRANVIHISAQELILPVFNAILKYWVNLK